MFDQLRPPEFAVGELDDPRPQPLGLELMRQIDLAPHDTSERRDRARAIGFGESFAGADAREPRHCEEGYGEHEHELRAYVEIPEHVLFSARNCLRHRPKWADLE